MDETQADLDALQALLDRSDAAAGPHLREVITPERRLTAADLVARLTGMRLLVLATATADGRPIAGPVDGIFYRGAFYFGTSPDSVRCRHLRQRPDVSACHLPGEDLAVTVHGRAHPVDLSTAEHAGFRRALIAIYAPRYGPDWEHALDSGAFYARIEPERMFTFHMGSADVFHQAMPFTKTLGIEPTAQDADEVRAKLAWDEALCTSGGVLHGGAIMSLADSTGAMTAFLNLPEGATATTTIESKTNFFRAVRHGHVEATSRPLHRGRRIIVVQTDVTDADGRHVARVTQTQAVIRPD